MVVAFILSCQFHSKRFFSVSNVLSLTELYCGWGELVRVVVQIVTRTCCRSCVPRNGLRGHLRIRTGTSLFFGQV